MTKNWIRFWNFLRRVLRPPRVLRFTTLGTYVVLLTIGIGLAAMNTGNNLVYIIFGMMLGFITASGVISEMSLRGLEEDWILPPEFFSGEQRLIRLIIKNQKTRLPSLGLKVEMLIRCSSPMPSSASIAGRFLYVPAGSQSAIDLKFNPKNRGRFVIEKIKIETQFPFGFFRKYLVRETEIPFIAYPKILPLSPIELNLLSSESQRPLPLKGWGTSFWGMKEFSEGDNPRMIAWKSSAKRSKLIVRETEREREKMVMIRMGSTEEWKLLSAEELESALSFAASLIFKKFEEGFAVGFLADDFVLQPSSARKNLSAMLSYLALFDPAKSNGKKFAGDGLFDETVVEILSLWRSVGH